MIGQDGLTGVVKTESRYSMKKTIDQISVFMENRPGQLSEILGLLAKENINLRALTVAEVAEYGVLRLIVDDPEKAVKVLVAEQRVAVVNKVMAVSVPDRPGGLCELINMLAEDNVDIEYMYSVFSKTDGRAYMIISAKDVNSLINSLTKHNIDTDDYNDMGIN